MLRKEQHGGGNEFESRLWGMLGATALYRVALDPADVPFPSHLPRTSLTSAHSASECFVGSSSSPKTWWSWVISPPGSPIGYPSSFISSPEFLSLKPMFLATFFF